MTGVNITLREIIVGNKLDLSYNFVVTLVAYLIYKNWLKESLKIVFLVRDPRGVMNSRSSMDWCRQKTCSDAYTVCKDITADILAALQLKKKYPGKKILVPDPFLTHQVCSMDIIYPPFGYISKGFILHS